MEGVGQGVGDRVTTREAASNFAAELTRLRFPALALVARALDLPAHALLGYTGDRVWLPFGLAFEGMPGDIQESMLERLPPPVSAMWLGGGSDAFANEMAIIRGGTA